MKNYDGSHGYGYIANTNITAETKLGYIQGHISQRFIDELNKKRRAEKTQFNLYTFTTNYDGSLETIKDYNGNVYGFDHGSRKAWGF